MESFLTDPRVWVPAALGFITFIGVWSRQKTTNELNVDEIKDMKVLLKAVEVKQYEHDQAIALLQSDHRTQSSAIEGILEQLREVVRDLQRVAIKLAIGEHGKTQG